MKKHVTTPPQPLPKRKRLPPMKSLAMNPRLTPRRMPTKRKSRNAHRSLAIDTTIPAPRYQPNN